MCLSDYRWLCSIAAHITSSFHGFLFCVCQVEVLRLSNFMAILVDIRDYNNNNVSETTNSSLELGTYVYVGGVPATFGGPQFSSGGGIPVSTR